MEWPRRLGVGLELSSYVLSFCKFCFSFPGSFFPKYTILEIYSRSLLTYTRHMHIIREVSLSLTFIDKPFVFDLRRVSSFTQFIDLCLHSLSHCVLCLINTLLLDKQERPTSCAFLSSQNFSNLEKHQTSKPTTNKLQTMGNKVAASFGIVMAIFILLALTFWGFSAAKHSRHNTASHNAQHHAQLDAWITRMRRKAWRTTHVDRDVEMQVPVAHPSLPLQRPESAYVRTGPSRVVRMGRLDLGRRSQRVQFCDVPLTPVQQGQKGVTPAGFF